MISFGLYSLFRVSGDFHLFQRPIVRFFVLFLFFLPRFVDALDPEKAITQYVHDTWGKEQGMPQLSARSLVQSKDGYLWIATSAGLARFDGIRFTVYGPQNQSAFKSAWIHRFFKDREGNLWISTQAGDLIRYRNGEFTDFGSKFGIKNPVLSIVQDATGMFWLSTDHEAGYIQNSRFVPIKDKTGFQPKDHWPMYFDRTGQLWVESYRWKEGQFQRPADFPNVKVLSISEDSSGTLWFGTEGQGLISYRDGKFLPATNLKAQVVRPILEDRHHNLWVGTNNGLLRISEGKVDSFNSQNGLSSDQVVSLLEDTEGNLWVGTQDAGLNRFRDGAITPFSVPEGLAQESPLCVYGDTNGVIWVGTSQGLSRYQDGKFTTYTTNDGLPGNEILSLEEDHQGAIWIGTSNGISRYQNGKFQNSTTKDGLLSNIVLGMFADTNQVMWIGTVAGIGRYRNGQFETVYQPKNRYPSSAITQTPDGDVWVAVFGEGIRRFRGGQQISDSVSQGLSSKSVLALHADREGSLWAGTFDGGLNRYRDGKITQYTTRVGLHHDSVYSVLEDDRGNLWMSSNEGIFRVSKKELNDFADGKTKAIHSVVYGKSDGMRSVECNGGLHPVAWKSLDGKLWFITAKGVVRIDPNHLPVNRKPPILNLEELIVDGTQHISLEGKPGPISIQPGEGRLEFYYTGISLKAPEKVRFQYKLEGLDHDWIDVANRRIAYFTNISPGNYTFRVRAANADGIWNEADASVAFRLQPHFYQTWWFYALCGLAILSAVWQIQGYRLRRMLEMERLRMRIATDLHDDIGTSLTQISFLSELMQHQPEDLSRTDSLKRISESSREVIQSMSDIVWAVDPQKDKMGDLVLRMRKFANDLLSSKDIPFRFQISSLDEKREIDPYTRRHIFLIFKESINNMVKHSGCTNAEISLQILGNELILAIQDNGKGLVSENGHDGRGLRSMKQRAKEIGANFEMITAPNAGTKILLRLPLT